MRNVKVALEYEGTNYSGFQVQANANTIQAEIERALAEITGETIRIAGAGRTDAGVHAAHQVISFHTEAKMPAERFAPALNSLLPSDIRAISSEEVGPDFHARFSARSKTYEYRILNSPVPSAFMRNLAWWIPEPLDVEAMRASGCQLLGTHDFRAFRSTGSDVQSTVRTISDLRITVGEIPLSRLALKADSQPTAADRSGRLVTIAISSDGFLYNMVRIIVGTLVEVGRGRLPASVTTDMLATGERSKGGATAPSRGLCLMDVVY